MELGLPAHGPIPLPPEGGAPLPGLLSGERFGEIVGTDLIGAAVVQSHLRLLIAYLQAMQQ